MSSKKNDYELILALETGDRESIERVWTNDYVHFIASAEKAYPGISECLLERAFAHSLDELTQAVKSGLIRTQAEKQLITGLPADDLDTYFFDRGVAYLQGCCKDRSAGEEDFKYVQAVAQNQHRGASLLYKDLDKYYRNFARKYFQGVKEIAREDVFHDSLVVIIDKIKDGCFQILDNRIFGLNKNVQLKTFFIGVARRLLAKASGERQYLDPELYLKDIGIYDTSNLENEEDLQKLKKALEKLNDKCRLILHLWSEGHSYREIAEIMDLASENVARVLAFRCRERLRDFYNAMDKNL